MSKIDLKSKQISEFIDNNGYIHDMNDYNTYQCEECKSIHKTYSTKKINYCSHCGSPKLVDLLKNKFK